MKTDVKLICSRCGSETVSDYKGKRDTEKTLTYTGLANIYHLICPVCGDKYKLTHWSDKFTYP